MPNRGRLGNFFNRNRVGNLEPELEIVRRLSHHPIKEFVTGELVECGIHTDRLEDLGILAQTILLKPFRGNLAPILVASWR